MPEDLEAEECLTPWGFPPVSMRNWEIHSLKEAREVLKHHLREQRYEGMLKKPDVRFSHLVPNGVIIDVESYCELVQGVMHKPYQYTMTCGAEEIEKIKELVESGRWARNGRKRTDRTRRQDEEARKQRPSQPRPREEPLKAPLKQLHMFALA